MPHESALAVLQAELLVQLSPKEGKMNITTTCEYSNYYRDQLRQQYSASGQQIDPENAYGTVLLDGVAVICGHGGSMWLCRKCAESIVENRYK